MARDEDSASSDEEPSPYEIRTNRGNKLKRGARDAYEGKIAIGTNRRHHIEVIEYAGRRKAVVYKRRKVVYEEDGNADKDADEPDSDSDNPYADIKLDDLLSPITYPGDLPHHPALKRTYQNTVTKWLAMRALGTIIEEQKPVVQLAKLMSVFLGDDPSYILSEKLNLPEYNNKKEGDGALDRALHASNGSTNTSGSASNGEDKVDETRRITRGQISQEVEPFFALPDISIDRDFGIQSDAAEETRQLTQIALQRSEEFIRCMVKIRMDLLKADRYRRLVYRMCQGFNEEDDIIEEFGPDPNNKPLHPKNDNN